MKLLVLTLALAAMGAAQPVRLHPSNPHYFSIDGKPAVLIASGEHYGALLNRSFDYVRYLDTLRADRLNLTRVFTGSYREVPGDFAIANNTLAPAEDAFLAPWERRDGKFDLARWDHAWFARLQDLLAEAGRRGIVVELVLFCPFYRDSMWDASPMNARNNRNAVGAVARTDVLALKDERLTQVQDAMVRKIVTELRDVDNLYYEICNEPYFGGVTLEWQEHISQVIAAAEAGFPKRHLIAQNWANGSKAVDRPNPLVGLFNFHYSRPPDSIAMNWKLERAIGNNETGFDGAADATYRIQGWDFLMAGGALYNNLDYSFTVGHEDGAFAYAPATPGGGSAALRRQLRNLVSFFQDIPFLRMQPAAAGLVEGPEGASTRALVEPGQVYAIYIHHGRIVKDAKPRYQVDPARQSRHIALRLPPGAWTAQWSDPRTGAGTKTETVTVGAEAAPVRLQSPEYAEDAALLVRRR